MIKKTTRKRKPTISALEPRILFDGAAVATSVDVLDNNSFEISGTAKSNETTSNDVTNSTDSVIVNDVTVAPQAPVRKEISFVDTTVGDYQVLADKAANTSQVFLVQSINEITQYLSVQADIDAIHIFSHGDVGEITVGGDVLNADTMGNFETLLASMKSSLTQEGDILLYGCNVASDGSGQAFIDALANATNADIAASNDITGAALLGGDWDLEVSSGVVESDEFVIEAFDGELAGLEYADLTTWTKYGDANGTWTVQDGGRTVYQGYNGNKMYFIGSESAINEGVQGTMITTDTDDDDMGFVLGYQDMNNHILFRWSRGGFPDSSYGGYSRSLVVVENGVVTQTLYQDTVQWVQGTNYIFKALYMENGIKVEINGTTVADVSGTFVAGKYGFYNYSQGGVTYGNIKVSPGSLVQIVPTPADDVYGVNQNTTLNIDKYTGILTNDYDGNLDEINIRVNSTTLATDASNTTFSTTNGSITLYGDGHFTYVPNSGFLGTDSFTYQLVDNDGSSSSATVTFSVQEPNVAPTNIVADNTVFSANAAMDDVVANLSTTDGNLNDLHDYIIVSQTSTGMFKIVDGVLKVANPASITSETTYNVQIKSTDLRGLSYTKTLQFVAKPDSDNDGVLDMDDIDDDNDGIIDRVETTENFQWAGGYSISGSSATGTIAGIGFTYTLQNLGTQTPLNIGTTTDMFNHEAIPAEYNVPNANPTIRNDYASINTLDFNTPILNPTLAFSSIGNSSTPVQIKFYNDIEILWSQNVTYDANTRTLTGREGNAVIKIAGELSQIKFDYLSAETYANFAFGADVRQDVDTDGDGIVDRLDTDSDNDGVLDNVEAQAAGGFGVVPTTLSGYVAPSGIDANGDGLDDAYAPSGLTPIDSNANGTADYLVDEAPNLSIGTLGFHDGTTTDSAVIAPNLVLSDVENHNIAQAKVQIDNFVAGDRLNFTNTANITGSYNTSTGVLTLTGTASVADYEAALKSVEFSKTNTNTTDRVFSFTVGSAIPYSGNGHYYEAAYFSTAKTWAQAKAFAESQTLYGMQGYLATITSAEENAFILSKLPADGWIGASDEAVEGTWRWVTGPENGQLLSYTNWNSGEPNNSGNIEDAGQFYVTSANPGKWNDLPANSTTLSYAIIEYGGMAGDGTPPVISGTATMQVNDAPTIEATQSVNYTEHDAPVIVAPNVTIADIDTSTIASARVSISNNFVAGDILSFTNDDANKYGNISASYNDATGVLTLSSSGATATLAQWQDAIENVKFSVSNTIEVVTSATKTISYSVNDGYLDSPVDTSSVIVTGYGAIPYIYGTDKVSVNEDSSVLLSGFTIGDDDTGILSVKVVAQHGNLSLGTTTGITGYSAPTKTLEITGTAAALQTALNNMTYTPDANYNGVDELVINASDDNGVSWSDYHVSRTGLFYNATNQHYYEFVSFAANDNKSWNDAKTAAESRTYLGLSGYLATVTSSQENALITSKLGGNGWFGASDVDSEGIWKWVSGPEAGTQFWEDSTTAGTSSESTQGSTVNNMYANWVSGEPNNSDSSRGGEDVAHFYATGANAGKWNDFAAQNTDSITGYIVEYGNSSTKPQAAKLAITIVSVNDLPVNNNVTNSVTTTEDTPVVFSGGNKITVTDLDSTTVTTTLSIGSGKGALSVGTTNATVTNNNTTTVQISGTLENVNAALEGLKYTPTSNANGSAYTTLTVATNDGTDTDTDTVTINITAVDDKPIANAMAATVGPNSKQSFDQFMPNFSDVDNNIMTEAYQLEILSLPTVGKFQVYDGSGDKSDDANWVDIDDISALTTASRYTLQEGRLVISMADLSNYRFDAGSNSRQSTNVNWRVMTTGDTSDTTGWSNSATGVVTILDANSNAAPTVNIYSGSIASGNLLNSGSVTINEDSSQANIILLFEDDYTPEEYIQGIISSTNTDLIDMSCISYTRSTTTNTGDTVTFTFTPKANKYGTTTITLGANDGDKSATQSFTLNVTSVNEQAIVDNFTKVIDEDNNFNFATINPADIYHDSNDVNANTNVSAVDYNAKMAIIQDAMMNPSDTDKQTAKATAITALVDANYFPQSFIIDTLPTNGDLYLGSTQITTTGYVVAIADLETLSYQPDANYYGTDSFTWHALDKEGLATEVKTATFTINAVNDAPVATTPNTIEITDTSGASITGTISSTLSATDVDNPMLAYSIVDGSNDVTALIGSYGTLTINSSTGNYTYVPNLTAITALNANAAELFTLKASDGSLYDTAELRVNISAISEISATYNEQAPETLIMSDTSIDTQESYGGGYVEFSIGNVTATEILNLQKVNTALSTNGEVSIVGSVVYLGDGAIAKAIGQIDGTYNGENGKNLRINFVIDFANGNFNSTNESVGLLSSTTGAEIDITGWTIINDKVNLGVDTIAGIATPEDTTNPNRTISATDKDGNALRSSTYKTYINQDSTGDNSIRMYSTMWSTNGYAIARGPYIYSDSAVSLQVGDTVKFDWKAEGGSDAYDVFGYIIDVNDATNYQIILNETGANARAQTSWDTESITVNKAGDYKFVFVSGTWDATGGRALGAQLYIDDVKVTQANPTSNLTSDVLEKIAQKVTYQNVSDLTANNGNINRTLTVTSSSGDSTPVVHTSTKTVTINESNDPVILSTPQTIYYTDTDGMDVFSAKSGQLSATDADSNTTYTYGIDGGTISGSTVTKTGSYGTMTLNNSTGVYTYIPNSNAINALSSNATEQFTLNVSDGSDSTDSRILTISIDSVNDAPLLGGTAVTQTYVENGSAIQVDPNITITDLEGTSYDGGYLSFSIAANQESLDDLSILNLGGITLSGSSVNYGGQAIGTVDSVYDGQNGNDLRINLNGNAYSLDVQALARAVGFSNPSDNFSTNSRTIEIRVNDGGDGGNTTARYSTKTVNVNLQDINDLPTSNLGTSSFIVEKAISTNPNGTLALGSIISFADLDDTQLIVKFETTNYGSLYLRDNVTNGLSNSQIVGNNSRTVTITGTIEQINATLAASDGITYTAGYGNDFITPGADYLKVTAKDTSLQEVISQKMVLVLPAIPNADSDNIVGAEDGSIGVDIDMLVADINSAGGTYVFGTGTADITNSSGAITTAGSITAFDSSKIIYADYDIDGDNDIDTTDTSKPIGYQLTHGKLILNNDKNLADDANFAQFTYISDANWYGVETFVYQYSSNDSNNNQTSNIGQIAIYVTAVNDAPVVSVNNTAIGMNEDYTFVFNNANAITLEDIDAIDTTQIFDLTLSVNEGKIELSQLTGLTVLEGADNSSTLKVQGSLTNLQAALNGLKYVPNQDYNGNDSLTIRLNDNANIGEGNILEDEKTINITINALNDAPVFTNQSENTVEGNTITGILPASDIDSASFSFSIGGTASTGFELRNNGAYNFNTSSYNYIGEGETDTIVIPIKVIDTEGLATTANFSITITGTNDTPIVDSETVVYDKTSFGKEYRRDMSVFFSDLDATDRFRFSATNLPYGLTINEDTGVISGAAVESGPRTITIRATDLHGAYNEKTMPLLVIAPPPLQAASSVINNTSEQVTTLNQVLVNEVAGGRLSDNFEIVINEIITNEATERNVQVEKSFETIQTEQTQQMPNSNNALNNVELTSMVNTNSSNADAKIIQASTDLSINAFGDVEYTEKTTIAFSTVGLVIEKVNFDKENIELKIIDTRVGQKYIVTLQDGSPLPDTLIFDPNTGLISGKLPEDLEELGLSIKAISNDGTTRVLNIKIDDTMLENKNSNNQKKNNGDSSNSIFKPQTSFESFRDQLQKEYSNMNNYGKYIESLFSSTKSS